MPKKRMSECSVARQGQLTPRYGGRVAKEEKRQSYLHCASSKVLLDIGISDDRHLSVQDRMSDKLTNEMFEALVIGMNGNSSITEHSFKTCCSDFNSLI
jgi:hypothetical protein